MGKIYSNSFLKTPALSFLRENQPRPLNREILFILFLNELHQRDSLPQRFFQLSRLYQFLKTELSLVAV